MFEYVCDCVCVPQEGLATPPVCVPVFLFRILLNLGFMSSSFPAPARWEGPGLPAVGVTKVRF